MSAPTNRRDKLAATPMEAAHYLGFGKTWIYGLIKAKAITHYRCGRRIFIPWRALEDFAIAHLVQGWIA